MNLRFLTDQLAYAEHCRQAGFLAPMRPSVLLAAANGFRRYGPVGGVAALGAARYGDKAAVRDERSDMSFRDLDLMSNAVANTWHGRGLRPQHSVAIMARNHRWFLVAVVAAAKCGARIVLLNTDFAAPQVTTTADREGAHVLVYDDEFAERVEHLTSPLGRWRAWSDGARKRHPTKIATWTSNTETQTLATLARSGVTTPPPRPAKRSKIVVLTSGTTGTPKGAPRSEINGLAVLGIPLSRVPFKVRGTTEMCAPLFHSLGFGMSFILLTLGHTFVLRRRFDPESALDSLERNLADAMVLVPVMLSRVLDQDLSNRDLTRLRIVYVAGSQLGSDTCTRALAELGPVVYNLYGSTEVAVATIAPHDLAEEPSCVGRVVRGSRVELLDDEGNPVPTGTTGRIFVSNGMQFDAYTTAEHNQQIRGLMSSGDVGHFDQAGRLFIDGRDDDMIVSGGENAFPRGVEELLEIHPDVLEVAVIGVPDETFGQRLAAHVVRRPGSELTAEDVQFVVRANLARYKIPRDVHFLDELPLNPTGKVLKRALQTDPTSAGLD